MFLLLCAQCYLPGKGFTYFVMFGGKGEPGYLPELRALNHFEFEDSVGYDAQYYAQLAMNPHLADPALRVAIDNLPYRARRILFCWTAYALALGNPSRALQIYAFENVVAWVGLAILLLRWFPPGNWGNVARWGAVLFSVGLCSSVGRALLDGPSLLLIAGGMALLEAKKPWWAAALLGVAGLGKETNVLGGAALPLPGPGLAPRPWLRWIGCLLLTVCPLVLWMIWLRRWIGEGGDAGARNFSWPFAGYAHKWAELAKGLGHEDTSTLALLNGLGMVALSVQTLFLLLRPRWREPWWRLGASYAALAIMLGDAVWEGYPGAVSRVVLPMTLAFNVLAPRTRWGWVVLALGNLTVIYSLDMLKPPGRDSARVTGPMALRMVEPSGQVVDVSFDAREWFPPEQSFLEYWRWSRGAATVTIHNPQPFSLSADISLGIKSVDRRHVTLVAGGALAWEGDTSPRLRAVVLQNVQIPPGDTALRFASDRPPAFPPGALRGVGFSVRGFRLKITGRVR